MLNLEVRDLESEHGGLLPRDLSLPPTPPSFRHLSRTHSVSRSGLSRGYSNYSMPRLRYNGGVSRAPSTVTNISRAHTNISRADSIASRISTQSLYVPRARKRDSRLGSTISGISNESVGTFTFRGEGRS